MTMELKSDRRIDWATPPGCPEGFQTRRVYAGRSDHLGGSPLEIAVALWTKHDLVPREVPSKLHGLPVNKRATPVVLAAE